MPNLARLTIVAVLGALGGAPAATLSFGHVDAIGIGYEAGAIEPHVHADGATIDGVPDVAGEFRPDEIVIVVPQSTADYIQTSGGRAAGAQWDPIGVAAGAGYWFLPQGGSLSDTLGAPFAGIASEELIAADWSTPLTITLTSASMPASGVFALGNNDTFGVPTFYISTLDGIGAGDRLDLAAGVHRHFNWYFTAPGSYELSFEISGTHATDGLKSASGTFTFDVVPESSTAVLAAIGALALLRRKR